MTSFKEHLILTEARREDLDYKEKFTKNKLDRLIVTLANKDAAVFTRMASRYDKIVKALKKLAEKKNDLNKELTDKVADLFNAEDAVLTRVVETTKFSATLAKETKKDDARVVDYEKIAAELTLLIDKELFPKVIEIYEKYTELVKGEPAKPALRISSKVDEALDVNKLKQIGKSIVSFVKGIAKWAVSYDKKLAALKKSAGIS